MTIVVPIPPIPVKSTANAWNALSASAFDCDSVSGFKRFLANYDLLQFYASEMF